MTLVLLGLDVRDRKPRRRHRAFHGRSRRRLVTEAEIREFFVAEVGEPRAEPDSLRRRELGHDRPIFARGERLNLELTLADEAQRNRLHPSRRSRAGQLAPQHWGQRETDQIVERPPRLLGIDEIHVEVAWVLQGIEHRAFGDLVERDALHRNAVDGIALLEHRQDMPRDGLALAIGIGGQIEVFGAFQRLGDLAQVLAGPRVRHVGHREVLVRTHRSVLGRQIADMAIARQHPEVVTEIPVDGSRFGGGFDDNDVH